MADELEKRLKHAWKYFSETLDMLNNPAKIEMGFGQIPNLFDIYQDLFRTFIEGNYLPFFEKDYFEQEVIYGNEDRANHLRHVSVAFGYLAYLVLKNFDSDLDGDNFLLDEFEMIEKEESYFWHCKDMAQTPLAWSTKDLKVYTAMDNINFGYGVAYYKNHFKEGIYEILKRIDPTIVT